MKLEFIDTTIRIVFPTTLIVALLLNVLICMCVNWKANYQSVLVHIVDSHVHKP